MEHLGRVNQDAASVQISKRLYLLACSIIASASALSVVCLGIDLETTRMPA